MSVIGTLLFCKDCGNLLDTSTANVNSLITCECCGAANRDTSSKMVITRTNPASFPSALRQKHSTIQNIERIDTQNQAVINQTCPECGRTEMRWYTLQLRSADEGSTVFYTCECGYKYSTNN